MSTSSEIMSPSLSSYLFISLYMLNSFTNTDFFPSRLGHEWRYLFVVVERIGDA